MKTVLMLEAVDMLLSNGSSIVTAPVSMVAEQTDEMENAQILLAAQDMVDKLAGMAEDIAVNAGDKAAFSREVTGNG